MEKEAEGKELERWHQERLDKPLLILEMELCHEPRNEGSFWKLEKKIHFPIEPPEEHNPISPLF